jgi:NADH-quinone oxidoreductase subunit J
MQLTTVLFYILAVLTGACAVAVVVTQNIVRAAVWLLFTLGGTAAIFFLLNADFVGATQLLVYVGGTLVLVVFGVMLTAQGPFINMRVGAAEWAIAMGVGLLLYGVLAASLVQMSPPTAGEAEVAFGSMPASPTLGEALLGMDKATEPANVTGIPGTGYDAAAVRGATEGTVAATRGKGSMVLPAPERQRQRIAYLLPFEIVSVHLLVVLIGAAYLARAKRRRAATGVSA